MSETVDHGGKRVSEAIDQGGKRVSKDFDLVVTTKRLAEVRLDKQVNGKCSECRLVFDVLDSCLVCGQMLCNKCLLQGFHASCIAYPAVSISLSTYKCGSHYPLRGDVVRESNARMRRKLSAEQ